MLIKGIPPVYLELRKKQSKRIGIEDMKAYDSSELVNGLSFAKDMFTFIYMAFIVYINSFVEICSFCL